MRSAFLDDADPEAISHAIRAVLEREGALVREHRHSRIRFSGMRSHSLSWSRAGYVGIYQSLGEREAEVRLQLRARWPWRILLAVASINVAILILTILTNPPGTTWSVLAIVTGLALITATVVYVGTLKSVRAEEASLMEAFDAELARLPDVELQTEEERELAQLEAELEGEIVQRKLDADQPKGSRFRLGPKKSAPAERADEKRARLLARKAELEARKTQTAPETDEPKP